MGMNKDVAEQPEGLENGDAFDEATGEHLGHIETTSSFPVEISIFNNGHWYVYKVDKKYEADSEVAKARNELGK